MRTSYALNITPIEHSSQFVLDTKLTMKLLIVACLIAVCTAQMPPVPMIADSFCGSGEIEFHQPEVTLFGKCED